MKKALYVPDARVREMVEDVKHLYAFHSVRETVEEGMRSLMREHQRKKQSFAQIAMSLQEETRQYLRDRYPQGEYEHKRFFDDLSGEA